MQKEVKRKGWKWATLTEEERNEIVDRLVDEVSADYGNTILKSSARNEYMIQRTKRMMRRTVWAVQEQLKSGEFEPEGVEVAFQGGRIDRVVPCTQRTASCMCGSLTTRQEILPLIWCLCTTGFSCS